jgi:thioredoxin reductase (NADPH)
MSPLDVAVIGAGPAGLATAIECTRQDLSYAVLDKGILVDSIRRFPVNMVFFTTPELLEIGDIPLVTPHEKPTRIEALKYYRRVAEHYQLSLHFYETVDGVQREKETFVLHTTPRTGPPRTYRAENVVVATGYYDNPNLLGVPGEELPKVSHYYREAHPYFGMDVAVIGGANSAAETALELFRSGVRVTLIHREKALSTHIKYWVRPDILNRVERKEIRALFETGVEEICPDIPDLEIAELW